VLSGVLLLIWFPLIFRLPARFPASTTLSLNPYLWHWLAVTGALFLLSATALALRLGVARRSARNGPASTQEAAPADEAPDGPGAHPLKDATPPPLPDRAAEEPAVISPIGIVLPDAELLDPQGVATTLYAVAGDSASVLVFYRGAWSPFCSIALSTYQEQLLPQLAERGIKLVAISPQKPDGSLTLKQKHELAFTVVSDPGNTIAGRLGILMQPADECRAAQLQLGLDLTRVNADGTVTLPRPTVVILDASHTVRWIDVHPDHRARTEPQQVISALSHLERQE
jgi:peroxiredoxin